MWRSGCLRCSGHGERPVRLQTILLSSILFGGASQVVFAHWGAGVPARCRGSVSVVNLRHAPQRVDRPIFEVRRFDGACPAIF